MPPQFWHHALQMETYLLNIIPSKVISNYSPTQILYHRNPSYEHLRVFGCLCYPLFLSNTITKLQARSTPCVFLGYPSNHRGYKCYDLSTSKIILSRHVVFDENSFPFASKIPTAPTQYDFLNDGLHPIFYKQLFDETNTTPTGPTPPPTQPTQSAPNSGPTEPTAPQPVSSAQTVPSAHSPSSTSRLIIYLDLVSLHLLIGFSHLITQSSSNSSGSKTLGLSYYFHSKHAWHHKT